MRYDRARQQPCDTDINQIKIESLSRIRGQPQVKAPKDKRLAIAELFAGINQNLVFGHFELDMHHGLIDYKTSVILGESELHDDILDANWWAMDTFFPAINMVLCGNITPKHAVYGVLRK